MPNHFPHIPLFTVIPFILMLASIAFLPIISHRFWEKNRNKLFISLIISIPALFSIFAFDLETHLIHTIFFDYVPFIILLGSLFVITGGIFVDGDIEATPHINTLFMAIGAVLASLMGTTGAAMLLIRPLLNTNKERKYVIHTVLFFIAIVANTGGLLTPLGDPPLFMLYLRGASFFWFLNLLPEWLFTNALLLLIYFFTDLYYHKKETPEDLTRDEVNIRPIKIKGKMNFIWLVGVILAVAFINKHYIPFIADNEIYGFLRDLVILMMAGLSLLFTTHLTRVENSFTWEPIEEVAYLFLGIFITMIPCIVYLEANAGTLGITEPGEFYLYSGLLSSFLDNTPTAVTFYSLADGLTREGILLTKLVIIEANIPSNILAAISVGSVFFGAMTYIGNGPNFMVKAIAERHNIKMPHFLKYVYGFSLIVLLPVFILVKIIFIR